jgi:hypothetical protein
MPWCIYIKKYTLPLLNVKFGLLALVNPSPLRDIRGRPTIGFTVYVFDSTELKLALYYELV